MRGLNYEQLYRENKEELMQDESRVEQIELKLEKRQINLVAAKRKRRP